MSRPLHSDSLETAVRLYFGLSQEELGRYLGVTRAQVAHLEAGRRQPSGQAAQRLLRLARLLPPPEGTGPPAPAFVPLAALPPLPAAEVPGFGSLPAALVRKRQRQVAYQAARLRWALHRAGKGAVLQARRQWGLPLLQALEASPDPAEQAHFERWLGIVAADVAATTPRPATEAAQALLLVRLLALDFEAATLGQLLAQGPA